MYTGTLLEFQRQVAFEVEEMAITGEMRYVCMCIVMDLEVAAIIETEHRHGGTHRKTAQMVYARISGELAVAQLKDDLRAQTRLGERRR